MPVSSGAQRITSPSFAHQNGRNKTNTCSSQVEAYLDWLGRVRGRTTSTLKTYRVVLGQWLEWRDGVPLRSASADDMERFVTRERYRNGGPGAPATQAREVAILKSFYDWATMKGICDRDPTRELHGPKVNNRNPKPVADDVWINIWRNVGSQGRAVLGLGYFCGLRRYEMVSLRPEQFSEWGKIRGFVRKGGSEDTLDWDAMLDVVDRKLPHLLVRRAWFDEALDRALTLRAGRPLVFPWHPDGVNNRLATWRKSTGSPHFSPHQLRHSAATNLLRAGVPLHITKELMNHTSIDVTMRYVKAGGAELRDWLGSSTTP